MARSRVPAVVITLSLAAALTLGPATPAAAATSAHVVTTVDDTVDPGDGLVSLREAVSLANTDGTESEIVLAAGTTYPLTVCTGGGGQEYLNASGSIDLDSDQAVTITGNGATIQQTCSPDRVLLSEAPITIRDLTITGGSPTGPSGGTGGGGAVYAYGAVLIEDSVLTGNTAWGGAAVYAGGDVELRRTLATDNTGAVSTAVVSTVALGADVTIRDSLVAGNDGGATAVVHALGVTTVENSTVTGNTGTSFNSGASVVAGNAGVTLRHATVVDNTATYGAVLASQTLVDLEASVVVNSGLPECHPNTPAFASGGGNVVGDTTCGPAAATDQTDVADPMLAAVLAPTAATDGRLPLPGSPVLDAVPGADCDLVVVVDQRSLPRPSGTGCDAGAVERQVGVDALVRRGSGPAVGDGIVNTTTVGQRREAVVGPGTTTAFTVRVENDGEAAADVVVRGPRGQGRVTATYRRGGQDVTNAVVAGLSVPLAAGASTTVTVRIRVAPGTSPGTVRAFVVRATGEAVEDRVRAQVRVR